MVKNWIPSRQKPKNEAPSSSPGAPRVGTRALTRSDLGRNLLSSLRHKLLRRRKPPAITATELNDEAPPIVTTTQATPVAPFWRLATKQPTTPKPPRGPDAEDSDESDDEEYGTDIKEDDDGGAALKKPKKKKNSKRKTSNGFNRWVPKLLNPVEKPRDRVHRRKKKHALQGLKIAPALFTDSRTLYKVLLAHVFAFLAPLEPARVTAYVNTTTAAAVRAFYELYCPPPRPQRYLVNRILENHQSVFTAKIMELLPVHDRVRASGSCHSFYDACNVLPLEFAGMNAVPKFLASFGYPRTGRFHKRFGKIPALTFNEAAAEDVVHAIQLLEVGDDSEGGDGDDIECFASVREISLRKVSGFSSAKGKYFEQLLQTLFIDHIRARLHTLKLIDLNLKDLQFKHLAKLWRGARFPALRRLSLAQNAFSSRFVRDWRWSFENEQFTKLEEIDVSDTEMTNEDLQRFIACLSTTPALQSLTMSNNLCSFVTIDKLRKQIESGSLSALVVLECAAITADSVATGHLLEVFQSVPPRCPRLQVVNVSGNPLNNVKAATQLARVFVASSQLTSGWPELTTINLSSMQLGDEGFQAIATAILRGAPTRLQYVDVSDNEIGFSIDTFTRILGAKKLPQLRSLALAGNKLGALEFEALGSILATGCCPQLDTLDLSANSARGEGIARFCSFLTSPPSHFLWTLDLSKNDIPNQGLLRLIETLAQGNCIQLHDLNLSRNPQLRAIVSFLDLIRSDGLPSLAILQVGYAQTRSEGHDLVQDTLRRRSVQELRRLKQLRFEERLIVKELNGDARAARDQVRCRQQSQRLRQVYDHLENEADRALRRRKQLKKSSQLHLHQEIARLKQERAHTRLCSQLQRPAA